ncbi:MAG: gamma-glutamylcyclotransferase [Rhizobiaceae bacterium]
MRDFWVFGYGSLMWNPGFDTIEDRSARIHGFHRALCIRSWVHRGTQENPGLVLGLAPGGSCRGRAFRVAEADREKTIAYLRERELVTRVYVETWRKVHFDEGGSASALVYVADRHHPQFAGKLHDAEIAAIVLEREGKSGRNIDYVMSTVTHLRQEGISDPHLEAVLRHIT